jgi:hypothetical protein
MKRHPWLIITAASLLGALLAPAAAIAAQFQTVEAIMPLMPVLPVVNFPGRPLPFPSVIPGPQIQLPSPIIPVVSIPGVIQVTPFVPATPFVAQPKATAKGFFPAAQKMFAAAPSGQGPNEGQLNAAFDTGAKSDAAAVETDDTVRAGSVEVRDPKKDQKKKPVQHTRLIQVPTWELENEIGI